MRHVLPGGNADRGREPLRPRIARCRAGCEWAGWPFVAFALTTVFGQLVSVYQYPQAVLLVLGGSTLAAIGVGFVFGREKRVWCRHLCPVNGVFAVLARVAPMHFRVDRDAWAANAGHIRDASGQLRAAWCASGA